jgi:hypothetical protein
MTTKNSKIFVSYSRKDSSVVGPLVQFLRVSASDVFRDIDNIPPGAEWRAVLADAIDNCGTFIVFWCNHSSNSAEVNKKIEQALNCNKAIIPIILDQTRLHDSLEKYNGIDLRGVLGQHEGYVERPVMGAMPTGEIKRCWDVVEPSRGDLLRGCFELKRQLSKALGIDEANTPLTI